MFHLRFISLKPSDDWFHIPRAFTSQREVCSSHPSLHDIPATLIAQRRLVSLPVLLFISLIAQRRDSPATMAFAFGLPEAARVSAVRGLHQPMRSLLSTLKPTLYTFHPSPFTLPTPCLHPTYTLNLTLYTLCSSPFTLHPTHYTLHPTP